MAILLFGMMLAMGIWETIGVASVLPFIAVASTPEIIQQNAYLATVYDTLGFTSTNAFLIFLGIVVLILVVGSLSFKALTEWAMARYVNMRSYSLSCRLMRNYLGRPYSFFLNQHSADLGKSVLLEVQQVVNGALTPAMQLVANIVVAILLFALVVNVEPRIALGALAVLGGSYLAVYLFVRKYLRRIGNERLVANRERFKIAQDALGGIKDVKVLGLEEGYMRIFRGPAYRYSRSQANNQIVAQLPQFVLQGLAFGGIIAILLMLLIAKSGDFNRALPILALYAFAGIRLLPALQHIYLAATRLRYSAPVVDALYADLLEVGTSAIPPTREKGPEIRLHRALELEHVDFSYPRVDGRTLKDLSLTIGANTTIGFVGPTGSGKTTIVDVILGLLEPQAGRLLVDGEPIGPKNVRAWQNNIGYVPQHIFLTDDTVAANIAFGVPPERIDMSSVERAARIAELHEFVTAELPQGYDTRVGERGIRLSGGQRQRIGIARALYHDPDMLIFDEATNALDNVTERAVMAAIRNVAHSKTIILIAHRLSTVRACDTIFLLDHGRITVSGSYEELLATSSDFRRLANA